MIFVTPEDKGKKKDRTQHKFLSSCLKRRSAWSVQDRIQRCSWSPAEIVPEHTLLVWFSATGTTTSSYLPLLSKIFKCCANL